MIDDIRVEPADWPHHLEPANGSQLVVGGPGTGKTEFLVRRAIRLLDSGRAETLLMLSFSQRGAADLDERVRAAASVPARAVDVATYHSFAARLFGLHAVDRGWDRPPDVLPGPDQERLIAELLASEDPDRWSPAYRPVLSTRTFADEVTDFVLRCREQLVGPGDLFEQARDRADWRGLPGFLDRYDHTLRERSVVDYGTLISEVAALLVDPAITDSVAERYDHVLVDEYQDTTHAQSVLLRRLDAGKGRVTAAADPYQSIYSFRGADVGNVARFPSDFSTGGHDAVRLILTSSFRVPAAILESAVGVTAHELPGAAGKVVPAPGDGFVEAYQFDAIVEEADWIAEETRRLVHESAIPLSRIAVFVRSKERFLPALSRSLERLGVPHDRPDRRLIDQPAVRFVLDLVSAANEAGGPAGVHRAVRRVLLGPMFGASPAQVAELARSKERGRSSWAEVLEPGLPDGKALATLLADAGWAVEMDASNGLWEIWSNLPQVADVVANPDRDDERVAWSSFAQVVRRWNERNPTGTLAEYCRHVESEEFEALPLLSYRSDGHEHLTIETLHHAKGLDFDVVFIADAVEGIFPDLRARDSLLGTRHLQPYLPTGAAGYRASRLHEERRLAYTAMTRASQRVIWTASHSSDTDAGTPSRFLPLAVGAASVGRSSAEAESRGRVTSFSEAEGALRRRAGDPSLAPPLRLAAVEVLARGEESGLRSPSTFAGTSARGPDTGIVDQPPRLSPSQAIAYETCPRRFALERKLDMGTDRGHHREFGSLVHAVLERVERAATSRGDRHGSVDEAFTVLDEIMTSRSFDGGAYRRAWRDRARGALANTYALWPSDGVPIGTETPLEIRRGGIEWYGRADRIEHRDGSVAIVDYKTGQLTPHSEAAASLQLGFYLIGAGESRAIAEYGVPSIAEMWFPMHPRKHSIAVRSFDVSNLGSVEERMADVAEGIRRENWAPKPGAHCDRCSVRAMCPAVAQGAEAFAG